jgi:hypothetical protein
MEMKMKDEGGEPARRLGSWWLLYILVYLGLPAVVTAVLALLFYFGAGHFVPAFQDWPTAVAAGAIIAAGALAGAKIVGLV